MATILLADDSGTAQRMGAQILSAEGHDVKTVSDGQAAIQMLSEFSPDLILADVFMPGKTGYEVCEFVKSNAESSWIPVLLAVAPMEPYDANEGRRVKADGLVTKPLDKSSLIETVQSLLASAEKPVAPEPGPPSERDEFPESSRQEDPAVSTVTSPLTAGMDTAEEITNQPIGRASEPLEPEPGEAEPAAGEQPVDTQPVDTEPPAPERMADEPSSPAPEDNESPAIVQAPVIVTRPEPAETEEIGPTFAEIEDSPKEELAREEPEPFIPATSAQEIEEPETSVPAVSVQESAAAPEPYWSGESAEAADEDKNVSGQRQGWQGLANIGQEAEEDGQFPALPSTVAGEGSSTITLAEGHLSEKAAPAADQPSEEPQATQQSATEGKAAPAQPEPVSSADTTERTFPQVAPLDYATVEQIVRETIEGVMPQIVERIATATGMQFPKDED